MNLTKIEREEVTKVYDTWLNSYVTGDVKTYDSFFDELYHFIGSTGNEHYLDRRDTTKFFADTGDQFAGKTRIRNNTRILEKHDGLIFVTEIFDTYFLIESEWTYYGKFRFTSALKKNKQGWRFIYQHFSTPDTKADEGETIGTEKIAAENLMLKEAVRRRTVELELKTRELEIESALERVRTAAMAMQRPDDLMDVCQIISEQLEKLDISNIRNTQLAIIEEERKNYANYQYFTAYSKRVFEETSYEDNPASNAMVTEMKKSANSFFIGSIKGEDLEEFREWRKNDDQFPDPLLDESSALYYYFYSIGKGGLGLTTYQEISDESLKIFKRFHKIFTLAYRRFMDIQQAEAQAREAQVEAALERVRSKTMAMHNSQDVGDTVVTLFDEVLKLGLDKSIRVGIGILEGNEGMETWSATSNPDGEVDLKMGMLDMTIHPMLIGLKKAWKSGKTSYRYDYIGEDVFRYYQALNNEPEYPFQADLDALPDNEYHKSFFYSEGILFSFAPNPISDEAAKVLDRFARVFGQTYRRYRDLQKAEAQAREAKIEASLERARAQSMMMQHSEELNKTSQVFHEQLHLLGIESEFSYLWLPDEEENEHLFWATWQEGTSDYKNKRVTYLLDKTEPAIAECYVAWESGEPVHVNPVPAAGVKAYFEEWAELLDGVDKFKPELYPDGLYYVDAYMKYGCFGIMVRHQLTEDEQRILHRFSTEFERAYTRFLDLQKAEERELEAVKEASLDRVRAEISSMRTAKDLERITPLIWRELTTLDVPFFRCGVFIVDDKQRHVQVYLTTPEGKSLGALDLDFDMSDLTRDIVASWRTKKVYQTHWNKDEFIAWTREMMKLHQIETQEEYQGTELPPESLHLHFIPFTQGMLYVGNTEQLDDEKIGLVKSLADAFSFAFSRYEDFVVLEKAKVRVEKALSDLKATQGQLIHAEKMASLGELTAGIAHEIQNPLNFVNNFSEVSADLIEELKEELKNGDTEEVNAIANDLLQNLEKINHHGKRADGIVKGMLQHSRSGSGQKEPTDLNLLADEYLRLAYHGLRARDKSFNAEFRLEAGQDLQEVNVIPQDIGRVMLNLINNAFQAVHHKPGEDNKKHKPEVVVSISSNDGKVEIRVRDNGPGIPDEIKDKIFQPFFTTKPTGEGTGLGLSLSYDIMKAHGGNITLNASLDRGSEFIISLPNTR